MDARQTKLQFTAKRDEAGTTGSGNVNLVAVEILVLNSRHL